MKTVKITEHELDKLWVSFNKTLSLLESANLPVHEKRMKALWHRLFTGDNPDNPYWESMKRID